MTKREFVYALYNRLSVLSEDERNRWADYYTEMIDDRIEDGCTEEEAVAAVGDIDGVVAKILSEVSPVTKEESPKRRMRAWEIILLILGSPIWLSLAVAAAVVLFSVYVVLWSLIISLFSIAVALGAAGIIGVMSLVLFASRGSAFAGLAFFGLGLICSGLAILQFWGSLQAVKGTWLLSKAIPRWIKRCFVGKGGTR